VGAFGVCGEWWPANVSSKIGTIRQIYYWLFQQQTITLTNAQTLLLHLQYSYIFLPFFFIYFRVMNLNLIH
jgi:hypothetical protein